MYREPSSSLRNIIWILNAKIETIPTGCRITAHLRPHVLMLCLIGCGVLSEWITMNSFMLSLTAGIFLLFTIRGNPKRNLDIISQAAGVDFTEHFIGTLWLKRKMRKSEKVVK